jgi:hypothetical protein
MLIRPGMQIAMEWQYELHDEDREHGWHYGACNGVSIRVIPWSHIVRTLQLNISGISKRQILLKL